MPPRSRIFRFSFVAYPALIGLAALWCWLAERPLFPFAETGTAVQIGFGLAFGLLMVGLSRAVMAYAWAQDLTELLVEQLGPITWPQALVLALLSSVGEELFFRAAMHPSLGLWLTAIIFGSMHFAPVRGGAIWAAWATVLGLAFGLALDRSGHLIGPVVAHATINAINLRHIGKLASQKPAP